MTNNADRILALDMGTSSVRGLVLDASAMPLPGRLARRKASVQVDADGAATIDPADYLAGLVECLDELSAAGHLDGVTLVAASAQWHSLLPLSVAGKPLGPVLTWLDSRPRPAVGACHADGPVAYPDPAGQPRRAAQPGPAAHLGRAGRPGPAARLDPAADAMTTGGWAGQAVGAAVPGGPADPDDFHARTGAWWHGLYWTVRVPWLRERLGSAVTRFVGLPEYLLGALLDSAPMSVSQASGTGLLDICRLDWDPEACALAGIRPGELPVLAPAGWRGRLRPEFARRWPALRDARWAAPIGDGAASNVGSGGVDASRAVVTVGTSAAVRLVQAAPAGRPLPPLPGGLWRYRVDHDRIVTGAAYSNGGNLYAWARRELRLPEGDALEEALDRLPEGRRVLADPRLGGDRPPGRTPAGSGELRGIGFATTATELFAALMTAVCRQVAADVCELESTLVPAQPESPSGTGTGPGPDHVGTADTHEVAGRGGPHAGSSASAGRGGPRAGSTFSAGREGPHAGGSASAGREGPHAGGSASAGREGPHAGGSTSAGDAPRGEAGPPGTPVSGTAVSGTPVSGTPVSVALGGGAVAASAWLRREFRAALAPRAVFDVTEPEVGATGAARIVSWQVT